MSLKAQMNEELIKAMKASDKDKVSALRFILSSIKYREIDKRGELADEEVIDVLSTLVKQRKESIEQFKKGLRGDLVEKEERELSLMRSFMPKELSKEEMLKLIEDSAKETGAAAPGDMGKLMKSLMPKIKGRADGKTVGEMVKNFLAK